MKSNKVYNRYRYNTNPYTPRFVRLSGTYIDPLELLKTKTANEIYQERRLKPMDLRCKVGMCIYGTCREEFYLHESHGSGSKLYCDSHRHMALIVAQAKYRKTVTKETFRIRNAKWKAKHPNYYAERYQNNRAKNIEYSKSYRDKKKLAKKAGLL
jgi:hypothetical protein